jgi:TonB family protein
LSDGTPVYRPGKEGVGFPSCLNCPQPQYTEDARKANVKGAVVLQIVILPTGRAANIKLVKGLGYGLNEKAVQAVQDDWRFKPALGPDGKPVATTTLVEVTFRPTTSVATQTGSDEVTHTTGPPNLPCPGQPKSLKELTAAFEKGQLPSPSEVTGSWVEIGFFGQDERVANANCTGLMRGKVFEFIIIASQYTLSLNSIGMDRPQAATAEPDNEGSIQFPVRLGGDATPIYRCRITRPNTMTCLNAVYGEGIEFRKRQ